jgi:hypothetical protein
MFHSVAILSNVEGILEETATGTGICLIDTMVPGLIRNHVNYFSVRSFLGVCTPFPLLLPQYSMK